MGNLQNNESQSPKNKGKENFNLNFELANMEIVSTEVVFPKGGISLIEKYKNLMLPLN